MTRKAILKKRGLNKTQEKTKKTNGSKKQNVKKQLATSRNIMNKIIGHCGLEKRGEFCKNVTRGTNFPYDYCPRCLRGASLFSDNAYPF